MHFHILFEQHHSAFKITDVMTLTRHLIEAAGHSATYEMDLFGARGCYVVLEPFSEHMEEKILHLKKLGLDVIIVGTEFDPTVKPIDFERLPEGDSASVNMISSVDRVDRFVRCARHARAVWLTTTQAKVVDSYRPLLGNIPLLLLPPCFVPTLFSPLSKSRDIGGFFSGTRSHRRAAILSQLFRHTLLYAKSLDIPALLRQELSRRAKICLDLKIHDARSYSSPLRSWYHLTNGNLVVREATSDPSELSAYVCDVPTEELVNTVCQLIETGAWYELTKQNCDRFENDWHIDKHAPQLIANTFQLCGI